MTGLRLLLATDAVGGVWTYSLELARALKPLAIETVLAVLGPPPNAAQRQEAAAFKLMETGLPLDWLEVDSTKLRHAAEGLAAIANGEGADIVQVASAALLAQAEFEQPCVAVQHSCLATWWRAVNGTALPRDFRWRCELVECGLNRASAIVAPSIAFAADTARTYDLNSPVLSVHNGRRIAVPPHLPQGDFVFTAGRLWDEGKNVVTLDSAAARIDVPFQAAGSTRGPNDASVELKHIQALGPLNEPRMAGLLGARPVYASAALYEPFGLSVLEAAQAGCALVLSDISTHREIWSGAAVFVPPREDGGFASAIRDLMEDRDERDQLGQLARARAQHYSPERMAAGMADIYLRVIEERAAEQPMSMAGAA